MKDKKLFTRSMTFTALVRFLHWVRAFCIFFLIFSGFYLAYPFLTPESSATPTTFLYATFRSLHIMAGFLLISVSLFRWYLFFTSKSKGERESLADLFNVRMWFGQIRNYLFLGAHPRIKGVYNPLQFLAYLTLMILIVIISLSGLILYYNVYHDGLGGVLASIFKWLEVALGGVANVRIIHHITTWAFILFIPGHVYMVVWNAIKHPDGGADSIVGGYIYKETHLNE